MLCVGWSKALVSGAVAGTWCQTPSWGALLVSEGALAARMASAFTATISGGTKKILR